MEKLGRKMTRVRIGPIGEAVLLGIAITGTISLLVLFPNIGAVIAPFMKKKKHSPKQAVQRNIESLTRSGLIKRVVRKDGTVTLTLTAKGRWEAMLRSGTRDTKKQRWDGLWRVVIFDVPQTKGKIRDELRRAMKLYGFRQLQQSVWVYPHACDDFLKVVKDHLGVSHDVLYMKCSYIENDKHLQKEFDLS